MLVAWVKLNLGLEILFLVKEIVLKELNLVIESL